MNNPSTIQQLREMKFSAMANEYELQLRDPSTYTQVPFDDRFGLLVIAEWNRRQVNRITRRIREARLDIPSATLEGIEYYEDRRLDKAEMMRFATCSYIEEEHHIAVGAKVVQVGVLPQYSAGVDERIGQKDNKTRHKELTPALKLANGDD